MFPSYLILAALWISYCVLHSVLASVAVKNRVQKSGGTAYRYYRLFYTVFAAGTLAAVIYYQATIPDQQLYTQSLLTNVAGAIAALTGAGIMAICIKKYFLSLSGLKSLVQEAPKAELMIAGIHRYMRHPLYLGTFLFIWGLWIFFPYVGLLIANLVITGYTLFAIPLEEAKLVAEFGDKYKEYQQNVPKLIPRF